MIVQIVAAFSPGVLCSEDGIFGFVLHENETSIASRAEAIGDALTLINEV